MKEKKCLSTCFVGCLYFSAGRLFRTVDRIATESFKNTGLSPSHGFLLMALAEATKNSASPSQLAQAMNLDPSTVTRLIEHLEKNKLVKRMKAGRNTTIHLLDKGAKLLPEIRKSWKDLHEKYVAEFGEQKSREMNKIISEI